MDTYSRAIHRDVNYMLGSHIQIELLVNTFANQTKEQLYWDLLNEEFDERQS